MSIEYVYNVTGGKTIWGVHDYTSQQSLPADEPAAEALPKAEAPKPDLAKERSWFSWLTQGIATALTGKKTGGAAACGGPSLSANDLFDGGEIPLVPPTDIPDGGTVTDSGVIVVRPGLDGTIRLPIDPINNTPYLPPDIWGVVEGQGSKFQETPWIEFAMPEPIHGDGLQNLALELSFGTDSTKIAGMPAEGCFEGLINVSQFNDADLDAGVIGCPDPGYEKFVACPGDEANRLKIYLAGYRIEAFRYAGGQEVDAGVEEQQGITTIEQLYTDPDSATKIGLVCGTTPNPSVVSVPKDFYSDGTLNIKFKLRSLVDATGYDENATYRTYIRVGVRVSDPVPGQN